MSSKDIYRDLKGRMSRRRSGLDQGKNPYGADVLGAWAKGSSGFTSPGGLTEGGFCLALKLVESHSTAASLQESPCLACQEAIRKHLASTVV